MFQDPIHTFLDDAESFPRDFRLVDGPTAGRTIRRSPDGLFELTIGHQPSNENKGFATQRSVVRLTQTKVDSETSTEVEAYAQLILSVPKTEFTATEMKDIALRLINFLLVGDGNSGGAAVGGDLSAQISRLYAGEP
jgi:hypothetical protein